MNSEHTVALPKTALAAVLVGPGSFEYRELPLPQLGPDEGLLRLEACGICGTDYEQYHGLVTPNEYYTPIPAIPGHEPLGVIAAIGERARARWGVELGDRVAVRSAYGCGRCEACAAFEPVRCPTRGGTYGMTAVEKAPALWGGYAEYMYLSPLSAVRKMSHDLPAEVAVMFNPLAAGLSWAATVPQTGPGDRVVILGPGQRGLCSVIAAREAGAEQIIITGLAVDDHKLELAALLGADETIVVEGSDPVPEVLDLTGGGATVVVDTTPLFAGALAQAIAMCRRRGRIVLAGLKGKGVGAEVLADEIVYNELTLRGVLSMPYEDFDRACYLIEEGTYPLERLHTHSFPIEQSELAVRTLSGDVIGKPAVHVAIVPGAPPGGGP